MSPIVLKNNILKFSLYSNSGLGYWQNVFYMSLLDVLLTNNYSTVLVQDFFGRIRPGLFHMLLFL